MLLLPQTMALSLTSIHLHKVALLALASNAVLKLWKWQVGDEMSVTPLGMCDLKLAVLIYAVSGLSS